MTTRSLALSLLPLSVLLAAPTPAQDRLVALVGGEVHPGDGPAIENGVVLMRGGKIQAVGGRGTNVPADATVIDCAGKVVTAGLVDAGTTLGVRAQDANEQGDEVTPQVRIVDAIDPTDRRFARVRRHGVTTVQINPGDRNVIGGLGAVLKTRGDTVREMLVRDESGLRLTMGSEPSSGNRAIRGGTPNSMYYRRPTTRMGVVWEARQAFYAALDYQEEKTVEDGEQPAAQRDPGLEVLVRVLEGELTVHTTAHAEQDIRTALRLAQEFGYRTLVEEATEAWRVIDELAASGVKVLLAAPSQPRANGSAARDGAEPRFHTLRLLAEAGVPFAIHTGGDLGSLPLVREAMFAVRHGLDARTALRAVTAVPAEILGIADRVGTLAAGKDADVVVWTASPFDPTATVGRLYIEGEEVQ